MLKQDEETFNYEPPMGERMDGHMIHDRQLLAYYTTHRRKFSPDSLPSNKSTNLSQMLHSKNDAC